jgi:dTDP-L-rhamnose 4-epimerase
VAAISGSCLLNGDAPVIYEDGCQTRDFVHVSDIVQANMLALEADAAAIAGQAFNVGTGKPTNLIELLELLEKALDTSGIEPSIPGRFRTGDIRHCYADISRISQALGYKPAVELDAGLTELAEWMRTQSAENLTRRAAAELERKGLVR